MKLVVTGADGFIGTNLRVRLRERGFENVSTITRSSEDAEVRAALRGASFIFHLAGVNRPQDDREFDRGNAGFTDQLCALLKELDVRAPIVFASSIQAQRDNPYGRSKRAAEERLLKHAEDVHVPVFIYRLPNVFGKWCRPNYNSAVATFCYQIARGLPITVNDTTAPLRLVYVDDVIAEWMILLGRDHEAGSGYREIAPVFDTTVGEVASAIKSFAEVRTTLSVPTVGRGLMRALYATYVSYLPPEAFAYDVPKYTDPRGSFVEMLKTTDSGQFSYFTAGPGVTRGEHYHHTKTEKFLVIQGTARFAFRHLLTNETREVVLAGGEGRVIESIPGWIHNVSNVGDQELIVMLWANEVFDRERPDTVAMKVRT